MQNILRIELFITPAYVMSNQKACIHF